MKGLFHPIAVVESLAAFQSPLVKRLGKDCSIPFSLAVVESLAAFQSPLVKRLRKDCSIPFSLTVVDSLAAFQTPLGSVRKAVPFSLSLAAFQSPLVQRPQWLRQLENKHH